MKKYLPVLESTFLFNACDETAIYNIIKCLEGYIKEYKKNEMIYNFYDKIDFAGIILKGEVKSIMTNATDSELVMRHFEAGSLFAGAYACISSEKSDMQIIAQKDSTILFLKLSNLFLDKAVHFPYASRTTANLLKETAQNNIFQARKVQILTQKHIRDRLMLYLSTIQKGIITPKTKSVIELPFNRQELANYLGVERSALSREMCRMKKEGLIDFDRNKIRLNIIYRNLS